MAISGTSILAGRWLQSFNCRQLASETIHFGDLNVNQALQKEIMHLPSSVSQARPKPSDCLRMGRADSPPNAPKLQHR